ncbi:TolC family protein [Flavihumibacter sp. UBA7668]|uniref:TolC family protein n=1 Tax=Flavihumibacter sp. UBA7668 TaxID=1946542 RepID=UPI0025B8A29C|nr:TolC family protein [Flavihumibacter sp. UBA7668]
MQEAFQIAAKGNRQLQIKWLESEKAGVAVKEAKSFLLPTISANGDYSLYGERPVIYLRNESSSPKLNAVKFGGRLAFDGSIVGSYSLLNPVAKSNIRMAGINEQISKQEINNTEENLALNIAQLYFTVLMNKEQQKVLEQSLLRNQRALKDSRSLFLQGKSLKTDTLSNYISVQNLHAAISALKNNMGVLSVQLNQLMGLEDSVQLEFTDSITLTEQTFKVTGVGLSVAMDNRKDLRIQSLRIEHSNELMVNAKAGFKPQLFAIAQYQVQNQSDNLKFGNYSFPRTSFAGVRLTVPIYYGNRLKYKSMQSKLNIKQNEIALADLKKSIQTELVSLNANLIEAYDQWNILQQSVEAAQINYTMMNDRYCNGLGNRLELTDAELALTKAKLDQLQAAFSIRLIELQLKRAMGILQLN